MADYLVFDLEGSSRFYGPLDELLEELREIAGTDPEYLEEVFVDPVTGPKLRPAPSGAEFLRAFYASPPS